jgi:homeobox protein cut-like
MSKSTQTQQVIDLWKTFNFESLKSELDMNVIEIAQQLEEGDQSRKKLIEQTKEFRKTLAEEQRKLVAPILKLFQVEVDSSSKRSKLMEQVLLKLYKQLIDLPDPCAALDQFERLLKKCERLTDIEIENKQLRETLDEYNNEFKDVKNQEVTIKLLKEKLKDMESSGETQLQQRIKEKEKEMQRIYADQLEQSKQIQFDLVKKLGDIESRCLSLQTQLNKAQADLFESKSKQDELLNGKSCEIDLLMLDLDKVNERCTNAERLNEQYLQQINSLTKQRENERIDNFNDNKVNELNEETLAASKLNANNFEIELIAKEKEIAHLVEGLFFLGFNKFIERVSNKSK